ncbi:hypothetical protein CsatB_010012 [Cannabis sativa]|uniref:Glutaredoxin domain-containing protein n=3 Tax=Cannabis sativa TaxID=3483 RepID=A0AB40ECV2_CANSA|nr:uncharacterized protein At5g39865 [Cannabis sativa]KAF4380112.1 hypothetical protein F8388_018236 [Cannabis sativa]KAF4387358.1 hypothetical protein G4B88_026437 [Cannabis sativa]
MWSPPWLRSPSRVQRPKSRPQTFSCSSFKDIQTLLQEEKPEPETEVGLLSPRRASIFHRVRIASSVLRFWAHHRNPSHPTLSLPDSDQRVVIFYTSLRVVRKTFEDCRTVRSILRGLRVPIDERDVSMDAESLDELQGIVGTKRLNLPMVFIGGRFVGGCDEIRKLNECGELKMLIQGLPVVDSNGCDSCGGLRFVVCDECDGSHKVYSYAGECGFRTCLACNENGLVKCPSCSAVRIRRKQT